MLVETIDRASHHSSASVPDIVDIGLPCLRTAQTAGGTWPAGTRLVSVDSHWLEHGDVWVSRFPEHLRDRAPRIIQTDKGWNIVTNGKPMFPDLVVEATATFDQMEGMYDVAARLRDIDAEGVEKELLFPQMCLALIREPDVDCRAWTFRAYNEYIASVSAQAPDRLYGVGMVNFWDPGATRESVEHIKALGLKTLMTPIAPGKHLDGEDINYASPRMTPFWQAIEDSGLPLCFHIGEAVKTDPYGGFGTNFLMQTAGFRLNFGTLAFGGVFDRHPGLKIVFVEAGISWVPSALQDADLFWNSYRSRLTPQIARTPSWYWFNHCYASFMCDAAGLDLLPRIGAERVMWSTDYPHNESTWGYSRSAAQAVFDATDVKSAQAIVGGTAIELFGLD